MQALYFLQNGPDTRLMWLIYALLGFMVLTIIVGSLAGNEVSRTARTSENETEEAVVNANPITKTKLHKRIKRASTKKKGE